MNGLESLYQELILDHSERPRLVAAGRARAAEHSWERCAEGLVDACRAATSGR